MQVFPKPMRYLPPTYCDLYFIFQLADAPADDKSKKKKRLDDLLSGLHAGKGNSFPEKKESPMDSLFRKATESATDLNKLQEMLGPLGGNPSDAKVMG